jgi:hypothetical protein
MSEEIEAQEPDVIQSRALLVRRHSDEYRITIPEGAKVTCGPLVSGKGSFDDGRSITLRVYADQGQKNLLLMWRNVDEIRDESVAVSKKVVKKDERKEVFLRPGKGKEKVEVEAEREESWEDL